MRESRVKTRSTARNTARAGARFPIAIRIRPKSAGFTLAELAIALLIIGLLLFVLLPTSSVMLSNNNRNSTQQKLNNIDSALVNYVIVNKRLPCPADGSVTDSTAGTEGSRDGNGDCSAFAAHGTVPAGSAVQDRGVVPWVALGLGADDVLDTWNNRITYRVGWGLTRNNSLDMSSCDPAGTLNSNNGGTGTINTGTCASTCTSASFSATSCTSPSSFLAYKGLDVKTSAAATTKIMDYTATTGAAYVLISHGDNKYGAYSALGVYQTPPADWSALGAGNTLEDPNWNAGATHGVTASAPPAFIDTSLNDTSNESTHFDDIIVRPLLFSVISRAQLGPRSH